MAANASLKDSEDCDVNVDNLEETTLAELIAGVLAQQGIPYTAQWRFQRRISVLSDFDGGMTRSTSGGE